ncbi:hypothetical protein P301_L31356 [Saccharomyces cerevisiae P301]|uniref:EC1118_1L7_2388p n=1 Tax=Saccharomyces cerevisiae (strain Lalvin EC1118 / Prise de mousse) TaxID=643680 RepID=C8ZDX5_YEAS8|nr:hypothetical protein P301_L31356 [Saccharomyces cerevisiae P301]EWG94506.1 hypothetical protein R103_L31346 [Saccharomyces cerevisiae R103]KZV09616.1 hypothetical protein WN66_04562 [Saccharomyces cerevisiae]CAY81591.1 EC1118_1L7_2388p [Saccharomyces cerevisiae EC1118]
MIRVFIGSLPMLDLKNRVSSYWHFSSTPVARRITGHTCLM